MRQLDGDLRISQKTQNGSRQLKGTISWSFRLNRCVAPKADRLKRAAVPGSLPAGLIRSESARFALHLGFVAKSARFPEIEKLPVARCTVAYMLPVGILFQVLKSGRSYCEVPQDIRSGATVPFWIGV